MDKLQLMDSFFHPKNVTLIGVSRNLIGPSGMILTNMIKGGYKDPLYLINKNIEPGKKILGRSVETGLDKIKDDLDLAFVIVPSRIVPSVLEECGEQNINAVVIISSGFAESILYNREKVELQRELVSIAKKNGFIFTGPNCNGIYSSAVSLNAIFGPRVHNIPGNISYVSRGGTAGVYSMIETRTREIGISKFINVGDAAYLDTHDFIEYYGQDPETKVIGAYSEGISNGPEFIKIAKKVTPKKPVVFYKSGVTDAGKRAALSHVGAIAGEYGNKIFEGLLKQTGIIPVESITELADVCCAFMTTHIPQGHNIGIVTFAGSLGVMISDACNKAGLNLPSLSPELIEKIDKNQMLPEYWSHSNPIDLTDAMNFRSITKIIKSLLQEKNFDGIVFLMGNFDDKQAKYVDFGIDFANDPKQENGAVSKLFEEVMAGPIKKLRKYVEFYKKPVFVLGPVDSNTGIPGLLRSYNVVCLPEFNRIARTFAALAKWGKFSKKTKLD
ncbi:MAG: CoA-binding protein [Candidatus Hodarchaeota archaeon]